MSTTTFMRSIAGKGRNAVGKPKRWAGEVLLTPSCSKIQTTLHPRQGIRRMGGPRQRRHSLTDDAWLVRVVSRILPLVLYCSGMMVQDPNRRRRGGEGGMPGPMDGERLFDLARQHGARPGAPGELEAVHGGGQRAGGAFTGHGQRLGGPGDAPSAPTGGSSATAAPSRQQQQQQQQAPPRHMVHLYRNGFTVDNGPLRSYHDPANAPFLNVSSCFQLIRRSSHPTSVICSPG